MQYVKCHNVGGCGNVGGLGEWGRIRGMWEEQNVRACLLVHACVYNMLNVTFFGDATANSLSLTMTINLEPLVLRKAYTLSQQKTNQNKAEMVK